MSIPALRLALDKSARFYDDFGRLHVRVSNISKATVNEYRGAEIPGCDELGLDPRKVYRLLRDPAELEKAAATSNNVQLLLRHIPVSADEPMREITVGSTGTDAAFVAPFLQNSLVIWDAEGIECVESERQKELSSAYSYTPDMTPGTYDSLTYDGVMRNLAFNHVALVESGRAGPEVVVGDSKMEPAPMALKSRYAYVVKGALAAALAPRLAQDSKVDLNAVLSGVTAKNFGSMKGEIGKRLTAATKGKLAKDAALSDVVELLDAMEKVEGEPEDEITEQAAVDAESDPNAGVMAFLKDKLSEDDMARCAELMSGGAADEDDDADGESDDDKDNKDPPAMDSRPRARARRPTPAVAAMDAKTVSKMVSDAVANERALQGRISEARDLARPFVGALAQDGDEKPEDILRLALDASNVDHEGVSDYVALRALVRSIKRPGPAPVMARDSAAAADWFTKNGIAADRILSA